MPSWVVWALRASPRALAAAALIVGATPALANGAEAERGLASSAPSGQSALAGLTPITSWDDDTSGDERDDLSKRLSARKTADTGSLVRRRPGQSSSDLQVAAIPAPFSSGGRIAFSMPVASRAVTSGFGLRRHPLLGDVRTHAGVDFAAAAGSPVVATADGTVSAAQWAGGYGLLVAVEHSGGRQTRYAHLSRLNVAAGQRVRQGEVIGFVGSTGRSTGPHLHYETRVNGRAVDPRR